MTLTRSKLILSIAGLLAVVAVAASPQLLGSRVSAAMGSLAGADPRWLALGALCLVGAFVCTVASWRAALSAAGGRICPKQAAARLGIGAMVNSVAPMKLGDMVKIALFSRAIDGPGPVWTTGGVYAGLAVARSLTLAALLVIASATGAMPLWPVFVLSGVAAAVVLAAALSGRLRSHPRIAQVFSGLAALERSPRASGAVLAWTCGMQLSRLGATIAAALALGLPHPVLAALLILPALDAASAFPITPGSIGVGSGAVAVALASRGIGTSQALGAGIAIQALETLVSVSAGSLGALYLAQPGEAVRRWTVRVATVGVSVALAAAVGAVWFDLF